MKYIILMMLISNSMWSQNLDKHQWKERVVLIMADKNSHEFAEQQLDILIKDKEKLIDRKIVMYNCLEEKCTYYNWKDKPESIPLISDETGFKIVLLGLDGGEKMSSTTVVKTEVIVNLIDAMPMRRQELKARKKHD